MKTNKTTTVNFDITELADKTLKKLNTQLQKQVAALEKENIQLQELGLKENSKLLDLVGDVICHIEDGDFEALNSLPRIKKSLEKIRDSSIKLLGECEELDGEIQEIATSNFMQDNGDFLKTISTMYDLLIKLTKSNGEVWEI